MTQEQMALFISIVQMGIACGLDILESLVNYVSHLPQIARYEDMAKLEEKAVDAFIEFYRGTGAYPDDPMNKLDRQGLMNLINLHYGAEPQTLFLADNCVSYFYKFNPSQAVRDMEAVLRAVVFNMDAAVEIFDAFFSEAEERVIGGFNPDWLKRFYAIEKEHTRRKRLTNPIYVPFKECPEWFINHPDYAGMPIRSQYN